MNPNDSFIVMVRDVEFTLTRSQVEFDSPNFFTACFLGNFQESQTRTVKISRDPVLFGIIFDYLCGYTVLPLTAGVIPSRMSPETALINLQVDAEFYQLDGLVQICISRSTPSVSSSRTSCIVFAGTQNNIFLRTDFSYTMFKLPALLRPYVPASGRIRSPCRVI